MGDFGDRLRQIQPVGERHDEASGKNITQSEFAIVEQLSAEERKALGSLASEVERVRANEAPMLGLAEWRDLLRRVRARLSGDLESEERRALREDVASMGSRRGRFWTRVAGVAVVAGAAAWYLLSLL